MEAAVAVVLAIAGGLWALSRSDIRSYRRLTSAIDYPLLAFCDSGIGIVCGSALMVWKFSSFDILVIGFSVSVGGLALAYFLRFLDWLHDGKGE